MSGLPRFLACTLVLLVLVSSALHATDDTVVVIGGVEVLRIRTDSGGFSAKQRADAMRTRLIDIYQAIGQSNRALQPSEVTLDLTPGSPSIRVRGMLLLSITEEDARVNGHSSLEDLARQWHVRVRDALVSAAPLPGNTQYREPEANPGPGFP